MVRRKNIDWSIVLVMPFFLVMTVPFAALGMDVVLKYKYFYPFLALWGMFHMSDFFVSKYKLSRVFNVFLVASVIWFIVFSMLLLSEMTTIMSTASQCMVSLTPAVVFHVLVKNRNFRELRFFAIMVLCGLALQSVFMRNLDVGAARSLAQGTSNLTFEAAVHRAELSEAGALGFGQVYTIALVLVGALFAVRKESIPIRTATFVLCLILLFGLKQSAYSTAVAGLIIGVLFFILSFGAGVRARYRGIMLGLAIALVLIVAYPRILFFMEAPLRGMGEMLSEEYHDYKGRLLSLADAVSGVKSTYAVDRASLYFLSLKTFVSHPLFGVGSNAKMFVGDTMIGGHSTFFDTFACGGIMLGAVYLFAITFYVKYIKKVYSRWFLPYEAEYWYSAWSCCACIYLIFSCVNTSISFIPAITFLVPSFPFIITSNDTLFQNESLCYTQIQ